MNAYTLITSLILSGSLGFASLSYLRDKGAVTKYMGKGEEDSRRVLYGVIGYLVYLLIYWACGRFGVDSLPKTLMSAVATFIIGFVLLNAQVWWRSAHPVNHSGAAFFTAREQAFENSSGGDIFANVFTLDGAYIGAGLIYRIDMASDVGCDFTLLPVDEATYPVNKNKDEAVSNAQLNYTDTKVGLLYCLTYYSKEPVEQ